MPQFRSSSISHIVHEIAQRAQLLIPFTLEQLSDANATTIDTIS